MRTSDLKSVIQPDMMDLLLTGEYVVHHIFPGRNRRKCEQYGFLVALRPALHAEVHDQPGGAVDKMLRDACREYWIEHIGTEDEFLREFFNKKGGSR